MILLDRIEDIKKHVIRPDSGIKTNTLRFQWKDLVTIFLIVSNFIYCFLLSLMVGENDSKTG